MINDEIVRPEVRDERANKRRELCKYCTGSGRATNPDRTNLSLVCCRKSWRQNEVVVLGENALAGKCRGYVVRPLKSTVVRYESYAEMLESPNKRLSDFFPKSEKYVYSPKRGVDDVYY